MSDDEVMRYVDGELGAAAAAAVEQAMAGDAAVRAAVARHRALRGAAAAAFVDVLAEPVPAALLARLRPAAVTDLAAARARRDEARADAGRGVALPRLASRAALPRWASLAALFVAGVLAGRGLTPTPAPLAVDAVLGERLDRGSAGAVTIAVSYRDHAGRYCRVFRDSRRLPLAGIACHEASGWRLQVASIAPPASTTAYRAAAADLPLAVTTALDAAIAGPPLDAAGEAAAAARGWRRPVADERKPALTSP